MNNSPETDPLSQRSHETAKYGPSKTTEATDVDRAFNELVAG